MGFLENVKSFLSRTDSKDVAKERLQLVLVHDRTTVSPEIIEKIREDILGVISSYMEINKDDSEINFHKEEEKIMLEANLSVKELKKNTKV